MPDSDWQPTHQHRNGGYYRVLHRGAFFEKDMTRVVVYDNAAGVVWVRPIAEFDDGRFTPVTKLSEGEVV